MGVELFFKFIKGGIYYITLRLHVLRVFFLEFIHKGDWVGVELFLSSSRVEYITRITSI